MDRKVSLLLPLLLALAACNSTGGLKVPFTKEKPFVAAAVPADFAVVVDENHDTYYARQHIRQRLSLDDSQSQTTYTTRRDYNNAVSNDFSQETPLSPVQFQNMWNDVSRYNLMAGSSLWVNWRSDADIYRRNSYTLQIRANGQTRTYTATNGFSGNIRPLMLQIEAVRLPITQNSTTPVVGNEPPAAPMPPAPVTPTIPSMAPTTRPAAATRPLSAGLSDGITVTPTSITPTHNPTLTPDTVPIIDPRTATPIQPQSGTLTITGPATLTIDRAKPPTTAPTPATPTTAPSDNPAGYHQLKIPARSSVDNASNPVAGATPTPDPNAGMGGYGGVMIPMQNLSGGDRN